MDFRNVRLSMKDIAAYADRYTYDLEDGVRSLVPAVKHRGYLTQEEFRIVGDWKSPRIRPLLARNSERDVEEATRLMLSTRHIRFAAHIPQALEGVGLPVASTLLHWFHRDPFPILDVRALWTLGIEKQTGNSLDFWESYARFVRSIRSSWGIDMRTLDRALWQYEKEHQPKGS